ncbi:hypothetical protein QFC24_004617 [Naganishia onofrii]|uniref:Uncharacterized protein n=2 Tax=Naganishia onofrii TaxID=1851511 RepID=A0ACC2XCB8_9TREE|nr:hypothetical protein QFC24_004617 [Naganishia onofrii]
MVAFKVLTPLAVLAASFASATPTPRDLKARWYFPAEVDVLTATIKDLQEFLSNGTITSVQLTQHYLDRIGNDNHAGLNLRAVIETAPYDSVMAIAQAFDDERANGTVRSGLHGIPMLFKDNINTDVELGMNTTAGGFALLGAVVPSDAPVSAKLRKAGVIVIGKANLSQYANFKGNITNGWSARGGQTSSAYVVGGFPAGGDPCGSSSGSGVGTSAGFAAAALGSETDGSIICPSNRAALYGIKMSVGLSSRSGVVPISSTQDTTGPMAKSAYDAALILENMVGYDVNDTATYAAVNYTQTNYTQYTMAPYATFQGMKIGVPRDFFNETLSGNPPEINIAVNAAIAKIQTLGASIQDPADLPSFPEYLQSNNETIVLQNDFKVDFGTYMSKLISSPVRTLEDVINFNDAHADIEFAPGECCQQTMVASFGTPGTNSSEYLAARAADVMLGATNGIDAVLDQYGLDALILPSEGFSTGPPAIVGYPIVTVPLGTLNSTGAPFGLSFIGRKWSEPTLIALMAAYEANFPPRAVPAQLM